MSAGRMAVLLLLALPAVAAMQPARAAGADCGKEDKVERAMSEGTYATVQSAMELLGKQKS
ncbi:MAG TPA: hypothetical protein VEQ17_06425, partial [Steroidobacteraceae bacterium]|nr:hypothetical protein [Steroidobacteraceae bacterium]